MKKAKEEELKNEKRTAWGKVHDKNRSVDRKCRKINLMSIQQVDVDRDNTDFLTEDT